MVSGSDDGRVFIWDCASGDLVNMLVADDAAATCAVPHPCHPSLASAGASGIVRIWEPQVCGIPARLATPNAPMFRA